MKNVIRSISIVGVMVGLLGATTHAAPIPAPSAAPSAKGAFQRDLLGVYGYNEKQVLQLEERFHRINSIGGQHREFARSPRRTCTSLSPTTA
jgi:hypothetical protein